ncbi:MAG TPA: sigma-70 family RNA polymerase sigma factor [Ktedonobacteraceae bacterium]|nr:sigma-70 family RNA polymerase sigma factor [Ktedonobacteraceae bacterium]
MQEEPGTTHRESKIEASTVLPHASNQLLVFIEEQSGPLQGIICTYVQSMGLATGDAIKPTALEILQETVIEALHHADRYDPSRRIMAWLLGIALNVIRRKKAETLKRRQRELSFSQLTRLYSEAPEPISENDLLDQLIASSQMGPEQTIESDEQVNALLSLVSIGDQQILRLALLEDFEGEALARRLGITSGATRVRLHRALHRLRTAWIAQQNNMQRGKCHE